MEIKKLKPGKLYCAISAIPWQKNGVATIEAFRPMLYISPDDKYEGFYKFLYKDTLVYLNEREILPWIEEYEV